MAGLSSALSSPFGGLLSNVFFGQQNFDRWQEFANGPVAGLNQDIMGQVGNVNSAVGHARGISNMGINASNRMFGADAAMGNFNNFFSGINAALGSQQGNAMFRAGGVNNLARGIEGQAQSGFGGLNQAHQAALGRARGLVGQMGQQEVRDINSRFNAQAGTNAANLASRGLSSATIGQSQGAMLERQRSDALGGAADRQAGRMLGVENTIGQSALAARQAGITGMADIGFGRAGLLQAGNQFGAGLGMNALGMMSNNASTGLGNLNMSNQQQLANLMGFGQFGLNAALGGAQANQGFLGQYNLVAPPMYGSAQIQPPVR